MPFLIDLVTIWKFEKFALNPSYIQVYKLSYDENILDLFVKKLGYIYGQCKVDIPVLRVHFQIFQLEATMKRPYNQ